MWHCAECNKPHNKEIKPMPFGLCYGCSSNPEIRRKHRDKAKFGPSHKDDTPDQTVVLACPGAVGAPGPPSDEERKRYEEMISADHVIPFKLIENEPKPKPDVKEVAETVTRLRDRIAHQLGVDPGAPEGDWGAVAYAEHIEPDKVIVHGSHEVQGPHVKCSTNKPVPHWLTSTAERIASMIMGQPFVERTQRLGELKQIDPTMYALVRKEMRDLFTKAHGRSLDDLDNLVKHLTKLGDKYGAFAHVAILPRLDRWLVCPNCKVKTTVKRFMTHVTHAFRWKDFDFCGVCPDCDYTGKFTREDRPDESQFDYVCMLSQDLEYLQDSVVWNIPDRLVQQIQLGYLVVLERTYWDIISAVKHGSRLRLDDNVAMPIHVAIERYKDGLSDPLSDVIQKSIAPMSGAQIRDLLAFGEEVARIE